MHHGLAIIYSIDVNYSKKVFAVLVPVFKVKLRCLGLHRLQLDGHVLVCVQVFAEAQLPEIAAPDFFAHPEVWADHEDGTGAA